MLFSFHSRYYFAIGLGECLGFGVHAPGLPTEFPIRRTLCSGITLVTSSTGLSPSAAPCSKGLRFWTVGWTRAPHLHAVDPHGFGLPCSVFDRLYSRNHDCFLFLCLLRCFNSAGTLSLMRMALRPGGPIRQSSVHRLLAPTRGNIAAWHDLHRLPSRAIPHLVCSNTTEVELDVRLISTFCLVQAAYAMSEDSDCPHRLRALIAAVEPGVCRVA